MVTKDHEITSREKTFAKALVRDLVSSDQSRVKFFRHFEFEKTPGEDIAIDVLVCRDCPSDGLTTFVTLNSSYGSRVKVELIGCTDSQFTHFGELLAGLAELIQINGWELKDGLIIDKLMTASEWKMKNARIATPDRKLWKNLKQQYPHAGKLWQVIPEK